MSKKQKKDAGELKRVGVNKKANSLVFNYSENEDEKLDKTESNQNKKKKKSTSNKTKKEKEKKENELKEQIDFLKGLKKLFNTEVSTLLKKAVEVIKKINNRFNSNSEEYYEDETKEIEEKQTEEVQEEEKFSVNSLIEINVIFTDNKKKPLYSKPKNMENSMYSQSDEIITKATISKIEDVFHETAKKLRKVPIPETGDYKGIPLTQILSSITEVEILRFLYYVRRFPSKYIAKNYRISESFAAWVMSGTPED